VPPLFGWLPGPCRLATGSDLAYIGLREVKVYGKSWTTLFLAMVLAVPVFAQQGHFSLHLDTMVLTPRDARTQARLAQWNTPMGRLQYQTAQLLANAGRTGLVGGGSPALAFRVKVQGGLPLHLVTGVSLNGVPLHEEDVAVIRWPWEKEKHPAHKVLSMDEQISTLLGSRLRPE